MELFHEATDWLESLASEAEFFRQGKAPTLEPMQAALEHFGRPDESFDWRVIVGGTAGKGTVCGLVEDVLVRSGESVVTLASPHVYCVTERIRINGKNIDPEFFAATILEIRDEITQAGIKLSYYETLVLAGIVAGQVKRCNILVGEIGLGGAWDAVNAVQGKRISALTFIGDDHRDILGPELKDIAKTKAGIFTEDCQAGFSTEQNLRSEIQEAADSEVEFISGIRQKLNKKLARKIVREIKGDNHAEFQKIDRPGRWEMRGDVILDGAHAKDRFEYMLPKLKKLSGKKIAVLAMAQNHDPAAFRVILDDLDEVIWTSVPGERAFWDPNDLRQQFQTGEVCADPQKALACAKKLGDKVLVTGSFYLCGAIGARPASD